jgi:alpha-L-rhamnosidase
MKYQKFSLTFLFSLLIFTPLWANLQIVDLQCEFQKKPKGIDVDRPRFSWKYDGDKLFDQFGFQIQIATNNSLLEAGKADVIITKEIFSKLSNSEIQLPSLKNKSIYYWRVIAWNADKSIVTTSKMASFETGIKSFANWQSKWISDGFDKDHKPSTLLRKTFDSSKKPIKATLYVSSGGYNKIFINGKRVTNEVLTPAYTQFDKRILYCVHNVTDLVTAGKNSIAAVLGNGWYNIQSLAVWNFDQAEWRARPKLLCELEIEYNDGTHTTIVSDASWRSATGPYLFNNLYSGDLFDARLEQKGWLMANFNDSDWKVAKIVTPPTTHIESQLMPGITENEVVTPVSVKSFAPNIYVVDFGKNFAGYCKLDFKAPKGTQITLKYGEQLQKSGRLSQDHINKYFQKEGPLVKRLGPKPIIDSSEVFQMDRYYCSGDKNESFIPDFTYHGFQYVEIESSAPIDINKESVKGIFIHTNLPKVGSFECSNSTLNKLHAATMQSYLSNIHSIPTDCPTREKNGWTADAYISIDLALLNYDGILFYEKWMRDFIDNQNTEGKIAGIVPSAGWGYIDWVGPTWDVAMFAIPDALFSYYGQTRAIEQLYPTLEKYLNYLQTREKNGMITFGIGDWVPVNTKTPTDFTTMCSYFYMNKLMSKFSTLIHKDHSKYEKKTLELKEIINNKYFNEQALSYINASPTSYAYPLYIGLAPDQFKQQLATKLNETIVKNNYKVDFGMLGSRYVPRVLAEFGFQETVMKMLLNDNPASWTSWIKDGLTTLPEWFQKDEYDKASLNHVFLGDISAWMTNYLVGIRQAENSNGFQNIIIKPFYSKDIDSAKGEYLSVNGKISAAWVRKNNKIQLKLTIPQNCKATVTTNKTVTLPTGSYNFEWSEI